MRLKRGAQVGRKMFGVARGFKPLSEDKQNALRAQVKDVALDGRHEMFKTSKASTGRTTASSMGSTRS